MFKINLHPARAFCACFPLALILTTFCFPQEQAATAPRVGGVVKLSLLGVGGEVAVALNRFSNVRAGFNAFSYSRGFNKDGVAYAAQLSFRSAEAHYDWFPFGGGFHVSPGLLAYNGNQVTAKAAVPGGQTFDLNSTTYMSDPADPVGGSGKMDFMKAAPLLTVGWGNPVRRTGRHWSIPFEVGAVYENVPRVALTFTGSACDATGVNCRAISSDPTVQSNVTAEQNEVKKDVRLLRFFPVISVGFGYRF